MKKLIQLFAQVLLLIFFMLENTCAQVIPDCNSFTQNGLLYQGLQANDVTVSVQYSSGQQQPYAAQTYFSYNVTGLTAQLNGGAFAEDTGVLQYTIAGTPNSIGNAIFNVFIGDSLCLMILNVLPAPTLAFVSELVCSQVTTTGTLTNGVAVSNSTFTIPYNGGNGGLYGIVKVLS